MKKKRFNKIDEKWSCPGTPGGRPVDARGNPRPPQLYWFTRQFSKPVNTPVVKQYIGSKPAVKRKRNQLKPDKAQSRRRA